EDFARMACNDDWQVAGRRKGAARRGKQASNPKLDSHQVSDCKPDKQKIINISSLSVFFPTLLVPQSRMEKFLFSTVCVKVWVTLLLVYLPRYQLAMLSCDDPVFSESEYDALKELGFTVLTENEEGKRAVYQPTLFYLMHCGKALYNNLLWRNWTPQTLPKLIIIGNSFHGIQESIKYNCKKIKSGVCDETSLPCSPRFLDVFSDTALIQFPLENRNKLPECMWIEPSEPLYQHCQDLEIIQKEKRS
uniref:SRR1 domain containing n=1 Tax=Sinocyclocheilus rhinocerous TaxID=307959 RepID=A0A673HQ44_9TELE